MALSEPFPEDVRRARRLGRAGASLEEAGALEDRLGAVLPASYRQFSLTSDGWLNTTSDSSGSCRPEKSVGAGTLTPTS